MPGPRLCLKPASEREAEAAIGNEWLAAILLPSLTPWTIRSSTEIKMQQGLNAQPKRLKTNEAETPSLINEQGLNLCILRCTLR
jgi:hypothetical protein